MIKNLYLNKQKIYYKTIKFDKFIIINFFILKNNNKKKKIFNIMYKLWGNPNELFFYLIYVILYSINLYLYKNKIWTFLSVINNFY